jgi:uncharacterized protein (DUF58 family)
MPATVVLNAALLAAIDDLSLLARTVVEGFFDGLHRSPFLGYSTEFSAYRAYTQGDALRFIDWKVWGRSDKFYVKQFEDDTNLRCQLFLDTSASMDFGSGDFNKFNYGRVLAAVLAYLMTRQHDAPGLVLFGEHAESAVHCQASHQHADEIFQALTRTSAGGQTIIGTDLFKIVESFTRRGLAIVISDLFTAGDTALELLRQLNSQRQEVILFHLLAPEERDLPYEGELLLEDSETGEELPVHADACREEYRQLLGDFCGRVRSECIKLETDYQQLTTDQPLDVALLTYLERRNAMG